MPDHTHLLFNARLDEEQEPYCLAEIMAGIRGPSAHRINKLLQRRGAVWDEEFFDHVPRYGELDSTVEYIVENPVSAGLVSRSEDYPWLWVRETL